MPDILGHLAETKQLEGALVTIDALGCQVEIADPAIMARSRQSGHIPLTVVMSGRARQNPTAVSVPSRRSSATRRSMTAAEWSGCNAAVHKGIGQLDDIAGRGGDQRIAATSPAKSLINCAVGE
jgi:hypothetical protein